jgi:YVTN family beta-propeller protein
MALGSAGDVTSVEEFAEFARPGRRACGGWRSCSAVTGTPRRTWRRQRWGANAITPDGKTLYVASPDSGTVTPITTATNTPGKPVKTGKNPFALVIAP